MRDQPRRMRTAGVWVASILAATDAFSANAFAPIGHVPLRQSQQRQDQDHCNQQLLRQRRSTILTSSSDGTSSGKSSTATDNPDDTGNANVDTSTTASEDDELLFVAPAALYSSDPNDQRYSASDWLQNIKSLPRSTILRSIEGPVISSMVWSLGVSLLHLLLKCYNTSWAQKLCISSKPHSFLVSALGLLLVFRTNSAYQRFAEGRRIWEQILSVSRNISRLAALYEKDLGGERKHRIFRLLGAFPYLLHHHIQPQCLTLAEIQALIGTKYALTLSECSECDHAVDVSSRNMRQESFVRFLWSNLTRRKTQKTKRVQYINGAGEHGAADSCVVDRRALPWCLLPPSALLKCADSINRPLWVCDRMSQEITNVPYSDNFTSRERLAFLSQIDKLSKSIGECERIHQTAVPLNYARHSLRSLTIWLFSLPFALVDDLGLLTAPVMGIMSWLFFGVYQIGYTIEDPFQGSLRMSILCDAIYRDVMYDGNLKNRRDSAFQLESDITEWNRLAPVMEEPQKRLKSAAEESPSATATSVSIVEAAKDDSDLFPPASGEHPTPPNEDPKLLP